MNAVQGQGNHTEDKARGIQQAISIIMQAHQSHRSGTDTSRTYWHIDLNSGSGTNESANCIGSPIAFLQAAAFYRPNYRAYFCDIRWEAIQELQKHVGPNKRCSFHWMDNRDILPMVAKEMKQQPGFANAFGTVLCDPNGYFYGDSVPLGNLRWFLQQFPKMDVILNLNIRTRRLIRGAINKRMPGFEDEHCHRLDEIPQFLNRSHWLLRQPSIDWARAFVLMIGSNRAFPNYDALDFVPFTHPRGQQILWEVEPKR